MFNKVNYNSITNTAADAKKPDKHSDTDSNKQHLFVGLAIGLIIGLIIGIIIGLSLQTNNIFNLNNNITNKSLKSSLVSHLSLVEQTEQIEQTEEFQVQQSHASDVVTLDSYVHSHEKHAKSHDLSDLRSDFDIHSDGTSTTWSVTARISDLKTGDIVAISSAHTRGLLKKPGCCNKVKADQTYDSNRNLWTVGYDSSKRAYSFKNLAENCYLQHDSGFLKCYRSINGNKGYWKWDDTYYMFAGDSSSYTRKYSKLKNKDNGKCPGVTSPNIDRIETSISNCDLTSSGFQFELIVNN